MLFSLLQVKGLYAGLVRRRLLVLRLKSRPWDRVERTAKVWMCMCLCVCVCLCLCLSEATCSRLVDARTCIAVSPLLGIPLMQTKVVP